MKKGEGIALLPIGVFLVLYLGLGILFESVDCPEDLTVFHDSKWTFP